MVDLFCALWDVDDNYSEVNQQRKVILAILSQKKVQPQNSHAGYRCTRHFCFFSQYYSLKPSSLGPQSRSGDVRWHSGSLKTDQDCRHIFFVRVEQDVLYILCRACICAEIQHFLVIFSHHTVKRMTSSVNVLLWFWSRSSHTMSRPQRRLIGATVVTFSRHSFFIFHIYCKYISVSADSEWSVRVVQHHQDGPINESARDCSVCVCVCVRNRPTINRSFSLWSWLTGHSLGGGTWWWCDLICWSRTEAL